MPPNPASGNHTDAGYKPDDRPPPAAELSPTAAYIATLLNAFPAPAAPVPVSPPPQPLVESLTERELEILHLIAAGLTNKEIAGELVISPGTVKVHTAPIYGKLEVNNRTQAVTKAGLLHLISSV